MTIYKYGSRGDGVKQIQKALHLYADGVFGRETEAAVKAFQDRNGLTVDGKVGPATYAKLFTTFGIPFGIRKSKRTINEIIVHCTATPEGRRVTMDELKKWHLERGFSDIGYHYVIDLDGGLHFGRNIDVAGAHCTNHNAHSIGVCYVGGLSKDGKTPKDTRTEMQKTVLLNLLLDLRALYPSAKIYGHRDFANKACPSFDAKKEYSRV